MIQPSTQDLFGQLVNRVKLGDQEAWNELVNTYNPKLQSVIRNRKRVVNRRFRNVYDTSDFSSELWKTFMERIHGLQITSEDDLLCFMSHVVKQKIIDFSRKQTCLKRDSNRNKPLYGPDDDYHVGIEPAGNEPTPSQYAMAEEVKHALTGESSSLDEDSALIVRLRSQNYSNNEIAEATGMNLRKIQRLLKSVKERFLHN